MTRPQLHAFAKIANKLEDYLHRHCAKNFTGQLRLNFYEGELKDIEKFERTKVE